MIEKQKEQREPISFLTTKRIPKRVDIDFSPKRHDKISFIATKREPKTVKVNFYKRRKHSE